MKKKAKLVSLSMIILFLGLCTFFVFQIQEKTKDKNVGNQPVTSMGNPKAVANKPIIAKNPLLIGSTFYTSIYINSSTDVMTQHVSQFGRETTVKSFLGGDTFGYAFTKDYAHAIQRSRHNNRTTKNPANSDVAVDFKRDIDDLISAYKKIVGSGVGTAVAITVLTIVATVPGVNVIMGLLTLSGITGGAYSLRTFIQHLKTYLGVESTIRIKFTMCLKND